MSRLPGAAHCAVVPAQYSQPCGGGAVRAAACDAAMDLGGCRGSPSLSPPEPSPATGDQGVAEWAWAKGNLRVGEGFGRVGVPLETRGRETWV